MSNLYILLILLFIFFLVVIGEIFKIKKDITKLNRMISLIIKEKKNKNE
tara:strand:+ start:438 stop:584 length:147 start_codon:yes stop_codon:yes gene_type:complete